MPSTRVSTGQWASGREPEIIATVQNALLGALGIPDWDRDVVVNLYQDAQRIVPSGNSNLFTRVEIILFGGRSLEAKRALYRSIVDGMGTLGVPASEIKTILLEMPPENWGIKGGFPASEVDPLTQ